MYFIILLY